MSEVAASDRTPLLLALGLGGLCALAVSVYSAPDAALAMAAFLVAVLVFFNRKAALYLIVPAMTLSPDIPMGGLPVRLEDLLMIPLAAGWLAHLCVAKERRGTPVDRLLIAYVLVGVAATIWGGYLGTAHLFTANKYVSATFHLLKRFEFVLLYFIVADTLETPKDVQRMTYVVLLSMVALSVMSLQSFLQNQQIALGPEGAPIHEPGMASLVAVGLAAGLARGASPRGKLFLGAVLAFAVAVLPLSLGRNYMAATLIILLYVGLRQQRWIFAVLPVIAVVAFLVYPTWVTSRILTLGHVFSPTYTVNQSPVAPTSVFYRVSAPLYYATLALGHSPIFGFGPGSRPLGSIDSEYVVQLFYTGLVGLFIFLSFGGRLIRMSRETQAMAGDHGHADLALGFQLVLAGYGIYSIFAASISPTHTGGPFFFIAGLAAVLHRSLARQPNQAVESYRAEGRSLERRMAEAS